MRVYHLIVLLLIADQLIAFGQDEGTSSTPRQHICYRVASLISIDGRLNEQAWAKAQWTEPFVDIEGDLKPKPALSTRVKMLWDEANLYFGVEMEEPHVWATISTRDEVIFHDNDFEIFLDPDGDTHNYFELEINALNTIWDLLLTKPYRDMGEFFTNWDFKGIQSAVYIDGTLNDPNDTDRGWYVEIAIPWKAMFNNPHRAYRPKNGEQWRINFSRVEWQFDLAGGKYTRRVNPATNLLFPEHNWVWSPQGIVSIHLPELWGYVQFSERLVGEGIDRFVANPDEAIKMALRSIYYMQNEYFQANCRFAGTLKELFPKGVPTDLKEFRPTIGLTRSMYEATIPGSDAKSLWHIRQDGLVWKTEQ